MSLQDKIKGDLAVAMKAKDEDRKGAIRVVLGEFARGGKKELSDEEVTGILKKLIKSEKELLAQKGTTDSGFITVIETYLPKMATSEEIKAWVSTHINFDDFKNKMQAMGPIMKHFGATADGNEIKKILQEM